MSNNGNTYLPRIRCPLDIRNVGSDGEVSSRVQSTEQTRWLDLVYRVVFACGIHRMAGVLPVFRVL